MHKRSSRLLQLVALMLVMLSLMGSSHEGSEAYQMGRQMGQLLCCVVIIAVLVMVLMKIFGRKR